MKAPKGMGGAPKLPSGAKKIANIGVFKVPKVKPVKAVRPVAPVRMGSGRKR